MVKQTIVVKGMVCNRCMLAVQDALEELGLKNVVVTLGNVQYETESILDQLKIEDSLAKLGLSLLEDKATKLVKELKALIAHVYSGAFDFPGNFRFTKWIAEKLDTDYTIISDAFIVHENKTIEQYLIAYRIDKVKELFVYSNDTLADIAFKLNFSSVAHLSAQFKKQTGLTPSFFKTVKQEKDQVSSVTE